MMIFQDRQIILIDPVDLLGRAQIITLRQVVEHQRQLLQPLARAAATVPQHLIRIVHPHHGRHQILRLLGTDPFDQHEHAMPTDRILRIHDHPQMGQEILHMCRLNELDSSPLHERQAAARQLNFQIEGVKAGAKEHGNLTERHAFFAQFQDFLRHKSRLRILPGRLHQRRQRPVQLTREQMFRIFLRGFLNDLVGQAENRLRAAVIFLQFIDLGAGEPGGKLHDVAERRTAERIDGL